MRARWVGLLCAATALAGVCPAIAEDGDRPGSAYDGGFLLESKDERFSLKINNRVQVRYSHLSPDVGDDTGSFRVRRYKLKLTGKAFGVWKYALQVEFAGKANSGIDELDDALLRYAKNPWAELWIGQYKSFFSRQFLASSGSQQFVDRSIASGLFAGRRQIGVTVVGRNDKFEYNAGIYNGNAPTR